MVGTTSVSILSCMCFYYNSSRVRAERVSTDFKLTGSATIGQHYQLPNKRLHGLNPEMDTERTNTTKGS